MQVRISGMEDRNKTKDDERRESEQQLLQAEEVRRTLEVKLAEAQRRSGVVSFTCILGLFYLYTRSLLPV